MFVVNAACVKNRVWVVDNCSSSKLKSTHSSKSPGTVATADNSFDNSFEEESLRLKCTCKTQKKEERWKILISHHILEQSHIEFVEIDITLSIMGLQNANLSYVSFICSLTLYFNWHSTVPFLTELLCFQCQRFLFWELIVIPFRILFF